MGTSRRMFRLAGFNEAPARMRGKTVGRYIGKYISKGLQ